MIQRIFVYIFSHGFDYNEWFWIYGMAYLQKKNKKLFAERFNKHFSGPNRGAAVILNTLEVTTSQSEIRWGRGLDQIQEKS